MCIILCPDEAQEEGLNWCSLTNAWFADEKRLDLCLFGRFCILRQCFISPLYSSPSKQYGRHVTQNCNQVLDFESGHCLLKWGPRVGISFNSPSTGIKHPQLPVTFYSLSDLYENNVFINKNKYQNNNQQNSLNMNVSLLCPKFEPFDITADELYE